MHRTRELDRHRSAQPSGLTRVLVIVGLAILCWAVVILIAGAAVVAVHGFLTATSTR